MSLFNMLRNLDRKFSWSFLGFILAFLLGIITVYDRFISDKYPQIYFDVLANTDVLDIKEDLPKLQILFDGINIKEQNLSLRVISVKVVNESSQHIRKADYDTGDPIGFRVQPGKIIRTDLAYASNDYLFKNLSFSSPSNNSIHFKDIIFDGHQYFVLKLLVLHPANQAPTIAPAGHIAGMKDILVREPYKDFGRISFLKRALGGSLGIHLFRMVAYFLISVLLFLALVIPMVLIGNNLSKRKRKRIVNEFKAWTNVQLNESDDYIFKTYMTYGELMIFGMNRLLSTQETLVRGMSQCLIPQSGASEIAGIGLTEKHMIGETNSYGIHLGKELIDAGFVKRIGESFEVDPHMKGTLDFFVLFLKKKGMISKDDRTRITITGVGTFTAAELTMEAKPADSPDKK